MKELDWASWANRSVSPALGECLFTFAVIADTHVDREGFPSASPFPVNELSNARTRYCFEDVKRLQDELGDMTPEFAIHLGDVVHPIPALPAYVTAANDAHDIMDRLQIPMYLVPGNHDVGDKPMEYAPAGVVRNEYLTLWEEHFGAQYQSFDHGDCHFVTINTPVINSGLALEAEQREWLENDLKANADKRIFFFLHYPPYLTQPDETEHYDNIAEPGRSWLLGLIERYKMEAMFAGHVHNFWYHHHAGTDCYLLPSTSNVRQDHSEIFRATPTPEMESGRNDIWKVGYVLVAVYENGHVYHLRRTTGMLLEKGETFPVKPQVVSAVQSREANRSTLGFEMRHPWSEITEVAPSGALDNFERKLVRNDYLLLALWDMGVRSVHVPLHDFADQSVRDRMSALAASGIEFTVLSQGVPSPDQQKLLTDNAEIIHQWEVVTTLASLPDILPIISRMKKTASLSVFLSKQHVDDGSKDDGKVHYHFINHGFIPEDDEEIAALYRDEAFEHAISGLVFYVARVESPWERISKINAFAERQGFRAIANVMMADPVPAHRQCNDLSNANRICEALIASTVNANCEVFVDTFMDLDRGHSVRNGVIDRFCNPRLAYHVCRTLLSISNRLPKTLKALDFGYSANGAWAAIDDGEYVHVVIMPMDESATVAIQQSSVPDGSSGVAQFVDLSTGVISKLNWIRNDQDEVEGAAELVAPAMISFSK